MPSSCSGRPTRRRIPTTATTMPRSRPGRRSARSPTGPRSRRPPHPASRRRPSPPRSCSCIGSATRAEGSRGRGSPRRRRVPSSSVCRGSALENGPRSRSTIATSSMIAPVLISRTATAPCRRKAKCERKPRYTYVVVGCYSYESLCSRGFLGRADSIFMLKDSRVASGPHFSSNRGRRFSSVCRPLEAPAKLFAHGSGQPCALKPL
mmetsp:Transcript_3544/g.8159  ORF Transcript_3544/g.8159 Transcript_3544/m.8159 type:complete len:207 (+) Transcript_3544:533-1153(+)